MKIAIIGKMGSGKSTFARQLGKVLNIPVTHLDKIYWKPGWVKISREELIKEVNTVMQQKSWIIDGNFKSTLDMRLHAADTILFFDINPLICLFRVFKRSQNKHQLPDKTEGVKERVSWKLIKEIIFYDRKSTISKLNAYKKSRSVYHIKKNEEAMLLLKKLQMIK